MNLWMMGCGLGMIFFGLIGLGFYLLDYWRVGYNEEDERCISAQ